MMFMGCFWMFLDFCSFDTIRKKIHAKDKLRAKNWKFSRYFKCSVPWLFAMVQIVFLLLRMGNLSEFLDRKSKRWRFPRGKWRSRLVYPVDRSRTEWHSVMLVRVWKVPGTHTAPLLTPKCVFSLMLHRFSYFAASSWSHKFAIVWIVLAKVEGLTILGWYWKKFKAGEGSYISSLFVEARGYFWSNLAPSRGDDACQHDGVGFTSDLARARPARQFDRRAPSGAQPLRMGDALQQRQLNPAPLPT